MLKKKILKSLSYISYLMSALHAALFLYGLIRSWLFYAGVWTPAVIGLMNISFPGVVKMLIREYLLPAAVYAVIGCILQMFNKKN